MQTQPRSGPWIERGPSGESYKSIVRASRRWLFINLLALTLVQLLAVVMAGLALLLGVWMLVVARRPWRKYDEESPPPRIRLLGLSYVLVFGSAMVQVV